MADSDLITRAAGGDPAAFQALVERHRSMVYRVAYQFAGNHFDAEDIAQDVFIKVYRSLDKFRQDAQLSSWMYRIVMNACIDHRRRTMPSGAAPFGEEAEHKMMNTAEETPGPEERAYAGELGQVLETEIARLISEMMGSRDDRNPAPAMPQVKKYQLEGMTAAYSALPQARGDQIERDHQPQTDLLMHVRNLRLFGDRAIRNYVGQNEAPGGMAISLHITRHQLGRTHSKPSPAIAKVNSIAKKPDPPDQRRAEIIGVLRAEAGKFSTLMAVTEAPALAISWSERRSASPECMWMVPETSNGVPSARHSASTPF